MAALCISIVIMPQVDIYKCMKLHAYTTSDHQFSPVSADWQPSPVSDGHSACVLQDLVFHLSTSAYSDDVKNWPICCKTCTWDKDMKLLYISQITGASSCPLPWTLTGKGSPGSQAKIFPRNCNLSTFSSRCCGTVPEARPSLPQSRPFSNYSLPGTPKVAAPFL